MLCFKQMQNDTYVITSSGESSAVALSRFFLFVILCKYEFVSDLHHTEIHKVFVHCQHISYNERKELEDYTEWLLMIIMFQLLY